MIETLRAYVGLEDYDTVSRAISSLSDVGWLHEYEDYGARILSPHPELREKISNYVDDPEISQTLIKLRQLNDPSVKIVGPLSDARPYTSYLNLLSSSEFSINYLGIATAAEGHDQTPILVDRAKSGVVVRVLLAAPKLAAEMRGTSVRALAEERVRDWRRLSRTVKNLHVRVTTRKDDMALAASCSIDKRILRLVVYENFGERSKQGVVIEFSRGPRSKLNVVHKFDAEYNNAWKRATPVGFLPGVLQKIRSFWTPIFATITGILAFAAHRLDDFHSGYSFSSQQEAVLVSILASISGSFWFLIMLELGARVRDRGDVEKLSDR